MSRVAKNKARFKALLEEIFSSFGASDGSAAMPGFIGQAQGGPLEHTTRRYIIDEMLMGLWWQLGRLSRDIVEEARIRGATMLRMDYTGVNPSTLEARLIVEAKAWDKPFIQRSDTARQQEGVPNAPAELLAAGIEHYKQTQDVKGSPIIGEWAASIQQLHAYVTTVFARSGHRVARVAITSGRWLVVFTEPYATFGERGRVDPSTILIFEEREIVEQSDAIYDQLARSSLVKEPPEFIEPTEIRNYASHSETARAFRALWIARQKSGAHFSPYPQINLYPAVIIERGDKALVPVVDKQSRHLIPHQSDDLHGHFVAVAAASDQLLAKINQQLGSSITAAPLASFPGFPTSSALGIEGGVSSQKAFVKSWRGANEFLVVTGESSHYLLSGPTVDACPSHSWANCHTVGLHHPTNAIIDRSFEPAAFFTTTELHHCAHREIHHRRDDRCHIGSFEEFLCCRACVFERICWTAAELQVLPCGTAPAVQQRMPAPADAPATLL